MEIAVIKMELTKDLCHDDGTVETGGGIAEFC